MSAHPLSPEQHDTFHCDGYGILPQLFVAEGITLLKRSTQEDQATEKYPYEKQDTEGCLTRLVGWNPESDKTAEQAPQAR